MATIEKIEPVEEAFARLRAAPLDAANGEEICIYRNAQMRIADFYPGELNPTTLYVLRKQVELLRAMRLQFIEQYGIDILRQSNILHVRTDSGEMLGMAPPFVEFYVETVSIVARDGEKDPPAPLSLKIPILKDGMHRAWLARELGLPIRCVAVHGALEAYRPYAYPNSWADVKLFDETPKLKKHYRRPDAYSFMRPLRVLRQIDANAAPAQWGRK